MKLIIKDYLRSLKERDELETVLCDLLSQIGMTVITKPQRGTTQRGVDVLAVGKHPVDDQEDTVYLFSIKRGDLGRSDWDGSTAQALRPSLNEILDVYIPTSIPAEHKNKPVCICLGGDVSETVRENLSQYQNQNERTHDVIFREWNGDKLAGMLCESFLNADLLLSDGKKWFLRALAMVEEPEKSHFFFKRLLTDIFSRSSKGGLDRTRTFKQANLCLGVLFSWCKDVENLESAYLSAELTLLYAFESLKMENVPANLKKDFFDRLVPLSLSIFTAYCRKIRPFASDPFYLSYAVKGGSDVDVNLRLFDVIGRLAVAGLMCEHMALREVKGKEDSDFSNPWKKETAEILETLILVISNNPILHLPYKDDFVIEISLAAFFLRGTEAAKDWITAILNSCNQSLTLNTKYPVSGRTYEELLEHPHPREDLDYRKSMLASSELYPTLAVIGSALGSEEIWKGIQSLVKEHLSCTNFQLWFPGDKTAQYFYRNSELHGVQLYSLPLADRELFERIVWVECEEQQTILKISAVADPFPPILFTGVRHHHLPVPIGLWWLVFKERLEVPGKENSGVSPA